MKEKPVLLIDNTSPISCSFMRFIIKSGGLDEFSFVSIKSVESKMLLSEYVIGNCETRIIILVDNGEIYTDTVAFFESACKVSRFMPVVYWYSYRPDTLV